MVLMNYNCNAICPVLGSKAKASVYYLYYLSFGSAADFFCGQKFCDFSHQSEMCFFHCCLKVPVRKRATQAEAESCCCRNPEQKVSLK